MRRRAESLNYIERCWTGPMANSVQTRVRYAMWDTMRLAARIAGGKARLKVLRELQRDMRLFNKWGEGDREQPDVDAMIAAIEKARAKRERSTLAGSGAPLKSAKKKSAKP